MGFSESECRLENRSLSNYIETLLLRHNELMEHLEDIEDAKTYTYLMATDPDASELLSDEEKKDFFNSLGI